MKYNCYYYPEHDKVIISSSETQPPNDEIQVHDLKINIATKEVERIFDFFKYVTVNAILNNQSNVEINYNTISGESFFIEESFKKLKELFDDLIKITNEVLISQAPEENNNLN